MDRTSEPFGAAPSPESVGIPSRAVARFIDAIDAERVCMHGFVLVRAGRIAAEGYWAPFTAASLHRMYSVSKSLVSLAVGLLIDAGDLALNDRVADFFPDKLPAAVHPYLRHATVRDLLMMATPHSGTSYTRDDPDWTWTFFNRAPSHPPGTVFSYDTSATVVLGAIVERKAGVSFLESMRQKFLDPIGFSRQAWCVETPEGGSWGGSGVVCTLRDMARVAWACTSGGLWGGRRVLPDAYVREATSKQIDNSLAFGGQGYGYQVWRVPQDGFAFVGMGSQLAYCFPGRDFLFACVADTQGIGPTGTGIVEPMYREIHASLAEEALPEDREGAAQLRARIDGLHVLPQPGALSSSVASEIDGRTYDLEPNPMGISWLRFTLQGSEGRLAYSNASGDKVLRFGIGRQVAAAFPETHYYGTRIGTPSGRPYSCLASAAWVEEHKLNLLVYITDAYLGTLKATFAFRGENIAVYMTKVAEWFLDEYQGFAGGQARRQDQPPVAVGGDGSRCFEDRKTHAEPGL
jgi:CubicO group peptidase (beta-lactamase class C family)